MYNQFEVYAHPHNLAQIEAFISKVFGTKAHFEFKTFDDAKKQPEKLKEADQKELQPTLQFGITHFMQFIKMLRNKKFRCEYRMCINNQRYAVAMKGKTQLEIYDLLPNLGVLYHYTTAEAALKILTSRSLLLSHPELLNDPFDAKAYLVKEKFDYEAALHYVLQNKSFPKRLKSFLKSLNASQVKPHIDSLEAHARSSIMEGFNAIRSLSLVTDIHIPSMWAHYANQHSGVAIGLNVQKDQTLSQELGEIFYDDQLPFLLDEKTVVDITGHLFGNDMDWVTANIVLPGIYTKSIHWQYEKEYRITRFVNGAEENLKKLRVEVPDACFAEVVLGDRIDPMLELMVCEAARMLKIKVRKLNGLGRDYQYQTVGVF